MVLTAEQFLSNLPLAIVVWTTITLCWSILAYYVNHEMMVYDDKYAGGRQECDVNGSYFLSLGSVALVVLLAVGTFAVNFIDVLVVFNVFITVFLIPTSYRLSKWWIATHPRDETLS